MGKKRFTSKSYLKVLIVVGLLAVIGGGAGTFASFNAEVTNPGNTFANGTLFLHAQPNGGTTCTSESDTINNAGSDSCTLLFPGTTLTGGTATATLKLTNAGTIDASDIKFDVPSCTVAPNVGGTGSSVTFDSLTCGDLQLAIQETASNYTTNVYCAYPSGAGACVLTPADNLGGVPSLTTLNTTGGNPANLTSGISRYYVIEINPNVLPANINRLQNRLVTFAVTWHIDQ